MKDYIAIFREPDGRTGDRHSEAEIRRHRSNWAAWMQKYQSSGNLAGGSSLTLEGYMIKGREASPSKGIYYNGKEIVGGFILLKAESMENAVEIMRSCPVYEFDGYAEVRAFQYSG